MKIEVPEEPVNLEDQEVTLILARDRLYQDAAAYNVPTSTNNMSRPKIKPSLYWHCNDCVVMQMEERDHIELVNLLNLIGFYNLLLKIQTLRQENSIAANHDVGTEPMEVRSGQINRAQMINRPKTHDYVGYREICPEIRRIFNENVFERYRILGST